MKRLIPMGRLARPEEIARAVRFLVSEENTYMTGQQVVVDGGFISG
ncbi:MAG: SDR family oxidoreductase, partial [Candidatus Omnitrophica bacterium]|nr:SDR family oxidoreductase [Candidatus Omnitrophota bacterium]